MNNELKHYRKPIVLTIFWLAFYTALTTVVVSAFYVAADNITTHTLPTGSVSMTTDYSKYVVGETINFTVKNNYNSSIFIENDCPNEPLAIYKLIDNNWVRQHDNASVKDCPDESRKVSVAAGQSISGNFKSWPRLFSTAGKYRIVAFVEYYNSLPYQDIEIIEKTVAAPQSQPVVNQPAENTFINNTPTYNDRHDDDDDDRDGDDD